MNPPRTPRPARLARLREICGVALACLAPVAATAQPTAPPDETAAIEAVGRMIQDQIFPVAEIKASAFLASFPKSQSAPLVRHWLAEAQHRQGRHTDALATLAPLVKDSRRQKPGPETLRIAAECYADLGRFAEAEPLYRDLLTLNPDYARSPEARLGLAWTLLNLGGEKAKEGETILDVIARNPDSPELAQNARLVHARWQVRAGRPTEAAQTLTDLLVSQPSAPARLEAHFWLGEILLAAGDYPKALGHFEQITSEVGPVRADLLMFASLRRGECALATGDAAKALESLEKVLVGGTEEAARLTAARKMIEAAAKAGSLRDTLSRLRRTADEETDAHVAGPCLLAIAEAELASGQHEAAITTWNAIAKRFPNTSWASAALSRAGETIAARGDPDRGLALLRAAAEQSPEPSLAAECQFRAAGLLFALGRWTDAHDEFIAIAGKPEAAALHEKALFNAMLCLSRQGKVEPLVALYGQFAKRFPQSLLRETAIAEQGRLESLLGNESKARARWQQILDAFPDSPRRHVLLFEVAKSLMREGKFEEALDQFEDLVSRYPNGSHIAEAHFLKLACRRQLGADSPDASIAALKDLLQKFPDAPVAGDILFRIGEAYFTAEDFANAQTWFTRLARNAQKHDLADDALYFAGLAALRRDDPGPAIALFEELAKEHPKSPRLGEARVGQGHSLRLQAKFEEALAVYAAVAAITPPPPTEVLAMAQIGEADCHYRLASSDPKRYARAAAIYEEVLSEESLRQTRPDLIHEAGWKKGQTLEKAGRTPEALEAFTDIVYGRLIAQPAPAQPAIPEYHWFGKAASDATRLLEAQGDWAGALSVYRLAESLGGPDANAWRTRRLKLQREHFLYD